MQHSNTIYTIRIPIQENKMVSVWNFFNNSFLYCFEIKSKIISNNAIAAMLNFEPIEPVEPFKPKLYFMIVLL